MDSQFPFLSIDERITFPPVADATEEGIVAVGGNLSPGMLLSAYEQGIFPWYTEDEPLLWWSPDPRFLMMPENLHVSKSMRKVIKKQDYSVTLNQDFEGVISGCKNIPRKGIPGTWITPEIKDGYILLHQLGYAHSVETWYQGELVGGLYGVQLGSLFFGESMFSEAPNASKTAFLVFAKNFFRQGGRFIDCQVYTKHLESLGAKNFSREFFLDDLKIGLRGAAPPMFNLKSSLPLIV